MSLPVNYLNGCRVHKYIMFKDSHEFACKLLEWLHEDTNRIQRPSKMPEIDNTTISEAEVRYLLCFKSQVIS